MEAGHALKLKKMQGGQRVPLGKPIGNLSPSREGKREAEEKGREEEL